MPKGIGSPFYGFRALGSEFSPPSVSTRPTLARTEAIGLSAHSFLAFAAAVTGDGGSTVFPSRWTGARNLNYLGFSSLKDRWDVNGVDRMASYSGALWVTEFTNPAEGWPAPDSARGIETLQYLYWYALTAQAKGCKAMFIYPPWSPEGMDLDAVTMRHAVFWQQWLAAHVSIPVYVMPMPIIVARFRTYFSPQSIYSDGLHLRGPNDPTPNQHMGALGVGLEMMMIGARPADDAGWNAEMRAQVAIVWTAIGEYACAGLGGTVTVEPITATDPLPDPAPLI